MIIRPVLEYFFPRGEGNRRKPAWGPIILTTYIGMFLFTFGHISAWHPMSERDWAPCKEQLATDGTIIPAADGMCEYSLKQKDPLATTALSFFGAIGWPFFWSWHLQAEKPHD